MKHGLRARSDLLPGEDAQALRDRLDAWTDAIGPRDELERYLLERAVQASWRLDRADRASAAHAADPDPDEPARLAAEADAVALLGRRLFWDPRGPTCFYPQWEMPLGHPPRLSWSKQVDDPNDHQRVVLALEATALGCAWMLDRWAELRALLDKGLPWQPHDQFKAVRLLGRQPLDAIDDRRVNGIYAASWALHEEAGNPLQGVCTELDDAERKRFIARLNDRRAARDMPVDAAAAEVELRGLIDEEESRLEGVLAGHLARAEATAVARASFDESPTGERLRRYEQASERSLVGLLEALRKHRREASRAKEGGPGRDRSDGGEGPGGGAAARAADGPPRGGQGPAGDERSQPATGLGRGRAEARGTGRPRGPVGRGPAGRAGASAGG